MQATPPSLESKTVVVTGGSRGLGLTVVEALVARRATVTVLARDAGRLDDLRTRLGVNVVAGDIADAGLADLRAAVLGLKGDGIRTVEERAA